MFVTHNPILRVQTLADGLLAARASTVPDTICALHVAHNLAVGPPTAHQQQQTQHNLNTTCTVTTMNTQTIPHH